MAIDVNVTKQLNKDFVQVEAQYKNRRPRYYQVPIKNADKFCHEYKETEKKSNIRNNFLFALAAVGGCGIGNILAINLKPMLRGSIAVVTGILAGYIANNICLNKSEAEQKQVLKQNRAIDITEYFRNSK